MTRMMKLERDGIQCWPESYKGKPLDTLITTNLGSEKFQEGPSGNVPAVGSLSPKGLRQLAKALVFTADVLEAQTDLTVESWAIPEESK